MRKGLKFLFAGLLALCAWAAQAQASDYPNHPIVMIVPFGPGSGVDTLSRIIGTRLGQLLGQPVIIENQAGGNALIAAMRVVRAPPDGYTLLMGTNTTHAANPTLFRKLPYDPLKDFEPVSLAVRFHYMLLVNPSLPVHTVSDLIAYCKANPGKVSYATGNGTGIVAGALFSNRTGTDLLQVPYKSSPEAMNDVVAGRVPMIFMDPTTAMPLVKAGKLRAIAVDRATPLLPGLPSFEEAGLPADFTLNTWNAIFAPAGTPKAVVDKLSAAMKQVASDPEVQARLGALYFDAASSTPTELTALVKREIPIWGQAIKEAKIEPQ